MNIKKEIIRKIVEEKARSKKDLSRIKREVAKKHKTSLVRNVDLLQTYRKMKKKDDRILSLLRTKPIRSLSGIVNVSVLTKPFPCPGECIYCPFQTGVPKSYLKNEPAVMRAITNKYDPKKQIAARLDSLTKTGHPTDKIELRIVGGTWSFYPKKYQAWFIKKCFDASNNKDSKTLTQAQARNEEAKNRIVCLSIETRPDFITKKEIKRLRSLGVTMVELGVQSLFDDVLRYIKRGHKVEDTKKATKLLKDAGFKVCYQVMMNLPKSTPKKDEKTFFRLFEDPAFRPDFLKIYPCVVLKEAPLYTLWKKREYRPFTDKQLIKIIKKIKKEAIPRYVRIQRLFRDISAKSIVGGSKISNLRENITAEAKKEGWRCQCIRCREVRKRYDADEKIEVFREDYEASDGREVFLTMENKKRTKLFAVLRLRDTKNTVFPVLKDAGIIREIRTYGQQAPIRKKERTSPQHKGLGKRLIEQAEKITKDEFKKDRIVVISGVGARKYWRKRGYGLKNTYMVKNL